MYIYTFYNICIHGIIHVAIVYVLPKINRNLMSWITFGVWSLLKFAIDFLPTALY